MDDSLCYSVQKFFFPFFKLHALLVQLIPCVFFLKLWDFFYKVHDFAWFMHFYSSFDTVTDVHLKVYIFRLIQLEFQINFGQQNALYTSTYNNFPANSFKHIFNSFLSLFLCGDNKIHSTSLFLIQLVALSLIIDSLSLSYAFFFSFVIFILCLNLIYCVFCWFFRKKNIKERTKRSLKEEKMYKIKSLMRKNLY